MSADELLGAVALLNPGALRRAQRLSVAVTLLRSGESRADAARLLRVRFAIGRCEAWRIVSMAADMAAPQPVPLAEVVS